MDKNKILQEARNNKRPEYEDKESVRGDLLSVAIAAIVGIVLFIVEYLAQDRVNVSLIAVGMTAAFIQSFYKGIQNKKTYLIVIGCVEALITLFALIIFFVQAVTK